MRLRHLDQSRFDAAPLIAFIATKEMNYGNEPNGRIPQGCGAYRTDQRALGNKGRDGVDTPAQRHRFVPEW